MERMSYREKVTRRVFLRKSSGLLIGAGLLARRARLFAGPPRKGMILGVRDVHLGDTGEKDCWAAMKSLGVEAVEVSVQRDYSCPSLAVPGKRYSVGTDDAISALKEDLRSHDRRISAFCLDTRFDEKPEEEALWTVRVARAAKELGVRAIRIDVVPRRLQGDEFLKFAIETCKKLVCESEGTGVRFGIENHGSTTNRVEFLEELFGGVGSERVGLTLDTANFYWFGYPLKGLYGIYEKFAARVCHTHCKSIRYPKEMQNKRREIGWEYGEYNCPVYEGDIDFRRFVGVLRGAGYDNDLCVEDESLGKFPAEERGAVLKKEVDFLRGLL